MASNAEKDRQQYLEKIKAYKSTIDGLLKWEKQVLEGLDPENTSPEATSKRFELVEKMFDLTSYYIVLNGISQAVLKKNNEDVLSEARKSLTRGLGYFEDLVSPLVDVPFSDYEEKVAAMDGINPRQRYELIKKTGLTIKLFVNSFRDDSKWKWTFVEIEGRFAAITKNSFDFKTININTDPSSSYYKVTVLHLRLLKKLLNEAADRYRERYETMTDHIDDFSAGLNFMKALRRIHIILNEPSEAEILKKKIDVWDAKLKSDMEKKKEEKEES